MKITLESTSKIYHLDGVPARLWEGHTESGIQCHAFITRISVYKSLDASEFQRELEEQREPTIQALVAFPDRMTL
jgi:hypothetical protein